MNNKRWIAAFRPCILANACFTVAGFAKPSTTMAQTRVAIVDVGQIFKSHTQFSQQLAALKQEAEQFKSVSLQQQQQLMQKAEVLKGLKPGSEDFRAAETRLAQESAAMEVDQRNKMRTLMQQEAQLHFNTYTEVNSLISQYCESTGTQLVLRYNSQQMDPNDPGTVMQRVNGSVVFHNKQNDITPQIVARVSQMGGAGTTQQR